MAKKAKYVRIQSRQTIQVTCGLQNNDVTNPEANIPDRLKVSPTWPRCCVIIKEGAHLYPSEITDWATVKALVNDKILTIGEFTDELDEENADVAEKKEKLIVELKANGILKEEETKPTKGESTPKLADIAGE